jgi:putative membrane protein
VDLSAETRDASRRTELANERTYLAWWRTGLTAFAVALASAKIVPELGRTARWPYAIVGAGFGVLGIVCMLYAERRRREVGEALRRGEPVPAHDHVPTALAFAGAALGGAVVVLSIL